MSTLTTLKAAAAAKLATAEADVKNYVLELEAAVNSNKTVSIASAVVGALIGAVAAHVLWK